MPLLLLAGCGAIASPTPQGPNPGVTVTGTVHGRSVAPSYAAMVPFEGTTYILLSDDPSICTSPTTSDDAMARTVLGIVLGDYPPPAGTFPINPELVRDHTSTLPRVIPEFPAGATFSIALLSSFGPALGSNGCTSQAPLGSVTVETSSSTAVSGSFDLRFGDDSVRGSFVATPCASLPPGPDPTICPR
jgi:hypothetical protein